ncbi:MAG: sugar ABC transporter permease [Desulfobacter sp.]|nr:sugar ABC transporter permease [Desulfobacter sp.]
MDKWEDNKAWFLVLPVFIIVAFSAIIPLMTVVNYSIQDIFGPGQRVFVGMEWFKEVMGDKRLHEALMRQFIFSGLVLIIEMPLGVIIALMMPKKGWGASFSLALLAYAGLRAIPDAYFQAARIDGASGWAVFKYIQLPKMRGVLTIALLLRFMDSFLIYAEPFVLTGGGPGNTTTFLFIYLVKVAVGQFDLGPAAAFSLIYFLIILLFCWLFYQALQNVGKGEVQ